jgi:hypothetical protein
MRALIIPWLVRLLCVTPFVVLVAVSLGLVILKRRSGLSPWLTRLTAPPFYLVSLPIATLIVGAEMLGLYSLIALVDFLSPLQLSWSFVFESFLNVLLAGLTVSFFFSDPSVDLVAPVILASLVGFWAATLISGYLLWRTVRREDHRQPASCVAGQRLRGLLLLIAFAWAVIYLVTYIGTLLIPFGPSSVG